MLKDGGLPDTVSVSSWLGMWVVARPWGLDGPGVLGCWPAPCPCLLPQLTLTARRGPELIVLLLPGLAKPYLGSWESKLPLGQKASLIFPYCQRLGGGSQVTVFSGNHQQQMLRSCSDTHRIGAGGGAPGESAAALSMAVAGACRSRSACLPHLSEPCASAAWVASAWGKLTLLASAAFEASHPLGLQHH